MTRTGVIETDCCVVGGGPAGMMAGLLFARAGVRTVILEKHADFLRDFRGDTVHPSTLEVMHELGLLDAFLQRPHNRLAAVSGIFAGREVRLTDFSTLPTRCKFIAMMPQWHFLDFLAGAGGSLPGFDLRMNARAGQLLRDEGRVTGVSAEIDGKPVTIRARLVIGADGRDSVVRGDAGLERRELGAPIDVLWFRVPRESAATAQEPLFNTGRGHAVVTIDRGDYFQCAFIIAKGGAEGVRNAGIGAFREAVAETVPRLAGSVHAIASFDDVKLLTVTMDRLVTWSRPGLLMIGDAAHAMSPVAGVGINLAIQDAVAAANLFAGPMASGSLDDARLGDLQRRREWPVKVTQFFQSVVQSRMIQPMISGGATPAGPPLPVRIVSQVPWLQRRAAAFIGLGVRPEHVRSPQLRT